VLPKIVIMSLSACVLKTYLTKNNAITAKSLSVKFLSTLTAKCTALKCRKSLQCEY
jgi:hypothetical protein